MALSTVAAHPAPTSTTACTEGRLSIDFPLETTELVGGQGLRVSVSLADEGGEPIVGANVRARLRTPDDDLFASIACADAGAGRYLADRVQLPFRGAGGIWRVVADASWGEAGCAEAERAVLVRPSLSDRYQELYGFWVEPPGIFGVNMAMYNLHSGGLHFEDHPGVDGSGRVILDNYRYTATGATFADLSVYWGPGEFPIDEDAASAHVEGLGGLYRQSTDTPVNVLTARLGEFRGLPAWRLTGEWKTWTMARGGARYPVEWTVLSCPHSDSLWTLAIYADRRQYMDNLRATQATFECPPADWSQQRQ